MRLQTIIAASISLGSLGSLGMFGCAVEDDTDPDWNQDLGADGKADGATDVCTKVHSGTDGDGKKVAICDQLFETAPQVRPPEDHVTASSASLMFVGLVDGGYQSGPMVVDRKGTSYRLVDASGKGLTNMTDHLPAGFEMPSNRKIYLVYQVAGTFTTLSEAGEKKPAIHVTNVKPAILLTAAAIDTSLQGPWEGTVSARSSATQFDATKPLAIHMTFSAMTLDTSKIEVWDDASKTLPDGERDQVTGVIDNFASQTLGSDGKCLASLADAGTANPFSGAKRGDVMFWRDPGMHFPGDDELVLTYPAGTTGLSPTGMGPLDLVTPTAFLLEAPSTDWTEIVLHPHGPPTGNEITLHRVARPTGGC